MYVLVIFFIMNSHPASLVIPFASRHADCENSALLIDKGVEAELPKPKYFALCKEIPEEPEKQRT